MYGRIVVLKSGKVKLMKSRVLSFGRAKTNDVRLKSECAFTFQEPHFATLTIDSNNKAWLKYVGQSVGSVWTAVNGTEISTVHTVPIFHLSIFTLGDVNFRFEFSCPLVTETQDVALGHQQQPTGEEPQGLHDNQSKVEIVKEESSIERRYKTFTESADDNPIPDLKAAVKSPVNHSDSGKCPSDEEDKSENPDKRQNDQKMIEEDGKPEEDGKSDEEKSMVEKLPEENSIPRIVKTTKRPRSVSAPVEESNRKKRRSQWKTSKTWAEYWTPTSEKRNRRKVK